MAFVFGVHVDIVNQIMVVQDLVSFELGEQLSVLLDELFTFHGELVSLLLSLLHVLGVEDYFLGFLALRALLGHRHAVL